MSRDVLNTYTDPDSANYKEMIEEIRKRLGFTTLRYHRLDDLVKSIGISPASSAPTAGAAGNRPERAGSLPSSTLYTGIWYNSALQMAAATLLPPFLPLATIYGVSSRVRISSLDWTTFTNPTGTPMTRAGETSPSSISS